MTAFKLTTIPHETFVLVRVEGELDLATVGELRSALQRLLDEDTSRAVVDLGPCSFVDSSGCRALAAAGENFRGRERELVIVCPPSNRAVVTVLNLVGLQAAVPVVAVLPGWGNGAAGPADGTLR